MHELNRAILQKQQDNTANRVWSIKGMFSFGEYRINPKHILFTHTRVGKQTVRHHAYEIYIALKGDNITIPYETEQELNEGYRLLTEAINSIKSP
jgi:hypothetical protein